MSSKSPVTTQFWVGKSTVKILFFPGMGKLKFTLHLKYPLKRSPELGKKKVAKKTGKREKKWELKELFYQLLKFRNPLIEMWTLPTDSFQADTLRNSVSMRIDTASLSVPGKQTLNPFGWCGDRIVINQFTTATNHSARDFTSSCRKREAPFSRSTTITSSGSK